MLIPEQEELLLAMSECVLYIASKMSVETPDQVTKTTGEYVTQDLYFAMRDLRDAIKKREGVQ